jgi:hypothetical protein
MRPATPCPVPSKKRQTFIPTRAKRGTFGAPFHCQSRNSRVAWLLLDSEVIQRVEIAESPVKRAFRGVRPSATHGRCPASPLLWPRPTTAFAFAIARPPKFLTELSRRVVLLCPAAPARPKPILAHGVGFTASELLAARNSSNETLRRRFICIATHLFVRQDSRIRVAPLTACSALRVIPSLRSALTALGGYVLITSRFVCDSCSFHHDSSAKLILAYQTLADPTSASIQE